MRHPRLFSALLVAAMSAHAAAGQIELTPSAVLRHFDVNDGVPNARVFTIAHTPDGYAWLGTYGGLARFDGVRFTTFTSDDLPILGGDGVLTLAVDDGGTLWIGTEEGRLLKHDAAGFRQVDAPVTPGRRINTIQPGREGRLWLGTEDGVYGRDDVAGNLVPVNSAGPAMEVTQLCIDRDGTPWALATGGRLQRWTDSAWQPVEIEPSDDHRVTALAAAAAGGVWCAETSIRSANGRGSRLLRITSDGRAEAVEPGPWPRAPTRSRIEALLETTDGRLWCATRGSGVYCRDADGTWHDASKGASLARADGISLSADPTGAVWVGTRNSGSYQISPSRVEARRLPDEVGDHVVTSVCARSDGSLWAGTDGSGVVSWPDGTPRRFGSEDGLPALDVAAVAEACGGLLHVATSRGIVRLDGDRFAPVPLPDAVRGAACLCMFADSADDLWAGTTAGVVHVGVAAADAVPVEDGTPLDAVALTEIATGRIVALARSGSLYELVDGRFRLRPDVPDLSSRARSIAIDADGSLWLGIYGSGITTVSGTTSRRFSMQQNGLPSSHVLAIVPWTDVMWVCSENGVFGCPLAEFAAAPPGRFPLPTWRVTEIEGLPEKVCTAGGQPVASLGPDRRLWVPNGRYVAGFSPGEIMEPMPVFPPVIERIIADGIDRELRPRTNQLLPVGTGRLEFHFTSPNTVAPERLQFRHQLVGFDAEWIDVADRRMVSYTGLPPGEYTFRLEVSDPMGSWRSLSRDLQFEIPPRFWQRRGVQAAAAAGLAGLLAAAGWAWERRRSRARLARLELERAREQERQRIARDIHDDLGSGLTEIVMLSDVASREAEGSPAASTAHAIADRARVLTRSMDEVVWAVNPRNDSAEGFITYFHRWAQAYLGNAGLRVRWDLPVETPDLPLAAEVRHHLFLACKEAVANVVKHAGATEARLTCRITPRGLDIGIADDGRGFVAGRSTEAGDGLANLRERLVAIGGTCDIRSKPGRGTHVRFFIPIDRAAGHPGPAQPR